jgi:hypothetical protein
LPSKTITSHRRKLVNHHRAPGVVRETLIRSDQIQNMPATATPGASRITVGATSGVALARWWNRFEPTRGDRVLPIALVTLAGCVSAGRDRAAAGILDVQ